MVPVPTSDVRDVTVLTVAGPGPTMRSSEVGMRTVTAPDGSGHTVRIEWIGSKLRRAPGVLGRRLRKTADRASDLADVPDVGCLDDIGGIVAGIVAIVVAVIVLIVVLPTLFWFVEVLVVVVLAVAIWAARVLFRRPWRVVHLGVEDVVIEECLVVGWRRAHATMVDAAAEVASSGSARSTFAAASVLSA